LLVRVFFSCFLFFLFFFSCGTYLPENEDDTLSPPAIESVDVVKLDDGSPALLVKYYGYNVERKFDGYNVYIKEGAHISSGTPPLKPNAVEPTISISPTEADASKLRSYKISVSEDNKTPLAWESYYTIIMKAHSRDGKLSNPSNEIVIYTE
jgi:hypothetical protein